MNSNYTTTAETWLIVTILFYFMLNGAQLFETFVLIPKWSAAPPASFQLFKGAYGIDLKTFWIIFHSIHEVTFLLAVIFCWQIHFVRNWLLILLLLHIAVRVWTLVYFAPNIIEFQHVANNGGPTEHLSARATLWRNLNYLRVAIFMTISAGQVLLWVKAFR